MTTHSQQDDRTEAYRRIADPATFHLKISGTRDLYRAADIEGQLRNTIVSRMADTFAESGVPFLDMAANQIELAQTIADHIQPVFSDLGLVLETFVVENLSLPEELQKRLDERIGMNMVGDMGRYTAFNAAQSLPIAAANEGGGGAGLGAGLGAGMVLAQNMMGALKPAAEAAPAGASAAAPAVQGETKFCLECGKTIPKRAKFCPECGGAQS